MHAQFRAVRRRPSRWALVASLLALAGAPGCGSGDNLDRQAVSGTVTLDGQPLSTGTIRFDPTSAEAGTQVSAPIQGGKYSLSRRDGPVPGKYTVQITSIESSKFEPPAGKMPGEVVMPKTKENVPAKYNLKSELTATVKSGQSEPIDFPLTSK
jgi:hypothetical protein